MRKVIEIVKEKEDTPAEKGLEPQLGDGKPFSIDKALEEAKSTHPGSGIQSLDEAFRRAFKYRPKKK